MQNVQLTHPESLSIVSESSYRCIDSTASESTSAESLSANLQSIPSKFAVGTSPASPESLRPIKIIVISDYICGFCYICDKILRDAIEACRDLPVRFDVEFRPFTLVDSSALPVANPNTVVYRNAYVTKKFGNEQAEMKLKALNEFGVKAGLTLAEDSIVCGTTQAHRLSAKAYKDGGQVLQDKFNAFIFDACLTKMANISDEDVLVDAAVNTGLMNKEQATEFLRSTEYLDCVETMTEAAKANGINGVPFVIIDGKWAVNGLQPKECFVQIFRKLSHLPTSTAPVTAKIEQGVEVH
ncbi:thioredoxin-like protein [Boletus edulis]|nr:thioredoxin-like protein [Boletus edulis]